MPLGIFHTGNAFPIVVGAFGEVNEDASKLITKLARLTAKTDFGKSMSPLVSHSRKGGAFPIMQSQPVQAHPRMHDSQRVGTAPPQTETLRQTLLCSLVAELYPRGIWSVPAMEKW